MNNAYEEIYRLPNRKYSDGSPVVIDTAALYKLPSISKIAAQVKLASISEETIIACKIIISAYEVDGKTLINEIPYSYLDLEIHKGDYFGVQIPIILPINTRIIDVKIQSVIFSNQTVWTANKEWFNLPSQHLLKDLYTDASLLTELHRIANNKYSYYPIVDNNIFQCCCGAINKANTTCYSCGKTYEELLFLIDENFLLSKRDERIEQEQILAETHKQEQLKAHKLRTKRIKTIKKITIYVLMPIILLSFIIFMIVNYNMKKTAYENAVVAYNSGDLFLAADEFASAGSYKDSEQKYEEINEYLDKVHYFEIAAILSKKSLNVDELDWGSNSYGYYENVEIDDISYTISLFYDEGKNETISNATFTNRNLNIHEKPQLRDDLIATFGENYTITKDNMNDSFGIDEFDIDEYDVQSHKFTRYTYEWSLNDGQSLRLIYDDDGGFQIKRSYIPSK